MKNTLGGQFSFFQASRDLVSIDAYKVKRSPTKMEIVISNISIIV